MKGKPNELLDKSKSNNYNKKKQQKIK